MLGVLCLFSSYLSANDKKPQNESTIFNETISWNAQLGFALAFEREILDGLEQRHFADYINLTLLVDVYYKGFFIQSDHHRADTHSLGGEVGYQLFVNETSELDIISKAYIAGLSIEKTLEEADSDIPILSGLKDRRVGAGIGLRYTRYMQDDMVSLDIATLSPSTGAHGLLAELFYSHAMPYRNWDMYFNSSLTYYPNDIIDYFYGVDASEVSSLRQQYKGSKAAKLQFEFFALKPLSESWTLNFGASHSFFTANITDSPIVRRQNATEVMLGVFYVF
ncbi:MipA/OmpV family protein [Thalassotalea ganghwensis]